MDDKNSLETILVSDFNFQFQPGLFLPFVSCCDGHISERRL